MAEQQTSIVITAVDKTSAAIGSAKSSLESLKGSAAGVQSALAGLASGAGVLALSGMVSSAISSAAALKQLSEQTGATVEGLSAMKSVARLSDTSLDQISNGLMKLSKNMAAMDDAGKDASRAIAAIGLDVEKIRNMKPDEAMQSIASAFSNFSDGAGKSAAAMMLFGKEGAKLLPFFNDMAAAGQLVAKVTSEQAAMADEYEKNLKRLSTTGQGWQKELAMGMLPALDTAAKTMLELANGTGGLREEMRKLSADGSIKEWTETGITALTYMTQAIEGVVAAVKLAGIGIAVGIKNTETLIALAPDNVIKATAGGDFGYVKRMLEARADFQKAAQADAEKILNTPSRSAQFRQKMDDQKANEKAFLESGTEGVFGWGSNGAYKPRINVKPKEQKAAAAERDPYESIIKSAREWIAVANLQLSTDENLTEAGKALAKMEAMSAEEKAKGTAATRALAKEELIRADIQQKLAAAKKVRSEFALFDAKELDALREEGKILNLNAISLARYQEEKKYENQITEKFFNVTVDANGEIVKTRKYTDEATDAALKNAEAHRKIAGGLAEEAAAKKLIQQYDQEIAQLKIDNTIYFDDAARQLDMLDKEAAKRRVLIESIAAESAERRKAEEKYSEWLQASQSRIGVDKLKEAWQSVDQVAHDAFVGMFESGQDTFKNLTKVLKSTLIDALYQMTVKKWVFSIFADVTGANTAGGIAGAAGSSGGILNLASTGNSLYSAMNGSGGGLYNTFATSKVGESLGLSYGASATTGIVPEAMGAAMTEMPLAGGLTGLGSGLAAAIPWIGGALAIASLLGGMFGKGGAPKQNYGTGFIGNSTGTIADAPYAKIAGQIGSGQAMTGQDELQKAIYTDSVKAIVAKYAPSSIYDVLLNSQINVKGRSSNINDAAVYGKNGTLYNFGPDTGQGQDAAQSFFKDSIPKLQLAIITDAFRNANADYKAIADSIVGTSTDMTDALSGLSADAVAAMQANLSGMATLFDAIKNQINGSVTGEAVASITKLAGGFATLTTQVNDYYSNFYSQEEKASKAHEQLATEFEKLNLAMPSTRDGFRKIVESLDITTEAGQKSFAALMGLSGAFASITDAAEVAKRSLKDISAERDGLQARLDQAMGNTAAIRQRELDALDPSNRALQQQIYALEDTKAAAEAAAAAQQKAADAAVEAARAAEQAYKDMLASLLSAVDNAYAGVERAVGAEKSKIDASYTEQVSALDAQYQASKAVFESQRAAAQQNLGAITQVADRLKSAVKSMQIESDGLLKNQRLMASNTLNAALSASQAGASLANFPGLEDALATVAKPAEQLFSTFQDYAREQGRLGATIDGLGKNADAQVSVAQMTLDSINGASQQAEQIYQRQKEQLASQHAADIKALDDILKNGQDQVDALKGIDKSVLSVAGAMAGLASAIAAYRNASGGGGGTYIGGSAASGGGATAAIGGSGSSAAGTAAASTPISADLSASLSGYMGYDELAMQYGKGWADQAMNDPSGSLWTQAILNKLYGGGVDMTAAGLESIFGAGNVPSSAQSFGDSLTQAQWDQVAAAADKTKAFGDIIGGILGATAKAQDAGHTGIYDQNGFLLANTGNYYVGSGAFTGAEYGLGQLPGSVSLAGEQAIIADNNNIASMLSGAPSASAVEMLYQSILGRSAESAGVDYWSQQMAAGLTSEQLAAQLMASDEYLKKINGFASGGTASAGYYLAGERGPELIHSDSATRIYPAEQTSALMARLQSPNESNAVLAAKLDAVIEELNQLRGCAEGTERHTRDTKNILRNVTQDGETFQTTVVA